MEHQQKPASNQSQIADNHEQITFSFESKSQDNHYKPQQQHRTIEQYMRLKTNESIEDKIGCHASQYEPNQPRNAGKRSISLRKTLKTQEVEGTSMQYQKQLMQQEYQLRIESLIKQYQLKFNKQEDYCKLIQWKYKEEIDNLNQQINILQESKKRTKNANKTVMSNCAICSDGQVINHLQNIINEVQGTHQFCLTNKKQLTKSLDEATNKLQILELQHDKLYNQFKNAAKQLRISNSEQLKSKQENDHIKTEMVQLRQDLYESNEKMRQYKQQYEHYEYKCKQYQNSSNILYSQTKSRDQQNFKNSKTTVQESHSVLRSIENSMNSSFVRSRDSQSKHKNSISKILIEEIPGQNNENRQYFKKSQENYKPNSRLPFDQKINNERLQNLKWKYF